MNQKEFDELLGLT